LDVLLPLFEKQCSCTVKMIAVGIGTALQMGQTGNADGPYSLTSFLTSDKLPPLR
jgi:ABC-type tungstate transport system permease subunit